METLIIPPEVWAAMRRQVSRLAPLEACGLLAGRDGRVELRISIPNAEHSPWRYRMDPRQQWRAFQRIESAGLDLLGIYHSHPGGPDHPSVTDIAEAMYPVVYVILHRAGRKWGLRGFRIEDGRVREVSLQVSPAE